MFLWLISRCNAISSCSGWTWLTSKHENIVKYIFWYFWQWKSVSSCIKYIWTIREMNENLPGISLWNFLYRHLYISREITCCIHSSKRSFPQTHPISITVILIIVLEKKKKGLTQNCLNSCKFDKVIVKSKFCRLPEDHLGRHFLFAHQHYQV